MKKYVFNNYVSEQYIGNSKQQISKQVIHNKGISIHLNPLGLTPYCILDE